MRLPPLLLLLTALCLAGCAALHRGGAAPVEQWEITIREYRQTDFTMTAALSRTEVTDDSCLLDGTAHFSFSHFKHGIVRGTGRISGRVLAGVTRLELSTEMTSTGYGTGGREFILEGAMDRTRGFGQWRCPGTSRHGAWSGRSLTQQTSTQGGL